MVFRIANRVMLLVFVLAAAVQFNDPDPVIWMVVYSVPALLCIVFERGRPHWLLPGVSAAAFFIAGAVTAARVPGGAGWFYHESGREAMGLFLGSFWMTLLARRALQGMWARPQRQRRLP